MRQLLFLYTAGLALCAVAASAADVTGKWSGFPGFLVLKQDGAALTGTVGQRSDEQYPFENGKVDGDKLSFTLGSFQANLHLEGETIQGTMTQGKQSMKVFLKRVDENAAPPTFDIASVKRGEPASAGGVRSSSRLAPGRVTFTNVSLQRLIMSAYNVKRYQITGPDWLDTENYDIVATFPVSTPVDRIQPMFQPLLADRFKLKFHRETKELPVYALAVDKGGLKLATAEPLSDGVHSDSGPKSRKLNGSMSLARLADALANSMDRPVVDFTGVKGVFVVNLEWVPDDAPSNAGDSVDGQSIYTALHALGLKLEPRKAPVEIIAVDSAEKVPVEN